MFINVQNNRISAMVVGVRLLVIHLHLKTQAAMKFYDFLKTKGVTCSIPAISSFNPKTHKKGNKQSAPSVCSMTAVGTFDDFQEWVDEFYPYRNNGLQKGQNPPVNGLHGLGIVVTKKGVKMNVSNFRKKLAEHPIYNAQPI
jgi:hypothetical protein